MQHKGKSIRPFIGAKDFNESRRFYRDLGFKERVLSEKMSVFHTGKLSFYLQDSYVKEWVDNTMLFLEVEDVNQFWDDLLELELQKKYPNIQQKPVRELDWGRECFLHDPSNILWHIGEFK
jgi:catechol 2,3-dioxygenase-like lactoylglutathione lyase family enzyme